MGKKERKKKRDDRADEYYIEVEELVKVYGDIRAVDGISIRVKRGEIFAFLGPNGAGKTTTVEIIETIREPTKGRVRIKGMDISSSKDDIKRIIGVLPQEFSSFDKLKVHETLGFFADMYDTRVDIEELIDIMHLREHADKLYENLSGGLKQKVGVAAAMVNDPEILFLDEPTTGLDPGARRDVWNVVRKLQAKGKTIFLTTHYMEEAEELADRVAIIHRGKIIAEGTVDELIERHGGGLYVNFKGGSKDLSGTLGGLGLKVVSGKNGDLCVELDGKDQLVEVLNGLKERGVGYNEINVRRSNLEEIFLKLTGEVLRGGGGDEA